MTEKTISPENIGEFFDNARNAREGWGIFLVQSPKNELRLELQKVDAMKTFETDAQARNHFRARFKQQSPRHVAVANEIKEKAPGLYFDLLMGGSAKRDKRRAA